MQPPASHDGARCACVLVPSNPAWVVIEHAAAGACCSIRYRRWAFRLVPAAAATGAATAERNQFEPTVSLLSLTRIGVCRAKHAHASTATGQGAQQHAAAVVVVAAAAVAAAHSSASTSLIQLSCVSMTTASAYLRSIAFSSTANKQPASQPRPVSQPARQIASQTASTRLIDGLKRRWVVKGWVGEQRPHIQIRSTLYPLQSCNSCVVTTRWESRLDILGISLRYFGPLAVLSLSWQNVPQQLVWICSCRY